MQCDLVKFARESRHHVLGQENSVAGRKEEGVDPVEKP